MEYPRALHRSKLKYPVRWYYEAAGGDSFGFSPGTLGGSGRSSWELWDSGAAPFALLVFHPLVPRPFFVIRSSRIIAFRSFLSFASTPQAEGRASTRGIPRALQGNRTISPSTSASDSGR